MLDGFSGPAGWLGAWATYALTKATFAEDVALATPRPTSDCNGSSCTHECKQQVRDRRKS